MAGHPTSVGAQMGAKMGSIRNQPPGARLHNPASHPDTMKLISLNVDTIRTKEPLPYALRDADGTLLAGKGFVIDSDEDLKALVENGRGLYVDESEEYLRSYVGKLYGLVFQDRAIGQIADEKLSRKSASPQAEEEPEGPPDWPNLQAQANSLLRDTRSPMFLGRLDRVERRLSRYLRDNPDGALLALFHLSHNELGFYSATHAMLVGAMCHLAARDVLTWPEDMTRMVLRVALTMNISMTELQDRLARQTAPLTPEQRKQVNHHAARSVQLLKEIGVTDAAWLDAVLDHHVSAPGPLADKTPAQRIARLIQRGDMFAARLAPRASRTPTTPAAAMQASYYDEHKQVDEAGAALIKAVGVYFPGSFVRLATNEVGMVVRRGMNTTAPRVAVLINREGMPMIDPIVRDTALRDYRVVASVLHRDVKLKISLDRMLPLTAAGDRIW